MKAFSRLAVLTALLFCTCPALQAQEDGLIRKLGNMLTRLNKVYDTTYVFKLDMPGVVSPTADLIWTGINLHRDISYKEGTGDFQGFSTVDTHLARRLFEKAGLGLSYGSLAFGYTVELARNGTQRNKYNNFSFPRAAAPLTPPPPPDRQTLSFSSALTPPTPLLSPQRWSLPRAWEEYTAARERSRQRASA